MFATALISLILTAIVFAIVRSILAKRRAGGCACSCAACECCCGKKTARQE